jgi:hypothetical protein
MEQQVPLLRHAPVGMTLLLGWLGVVRKNSGKPEGALQIPPLRYAAVGMTKRRVVLPGKIG